MAKLEKEDVEADQLMTDCAQTDTGSAKSAKKLKREENKAKKLHAYFELLKDKKLGDQTKPTQGNSQHSRPTLVFEADDIINPQYGVESQNVQLRSTLHISQLCSAPIKTSKPTPVIYAFDLHQVVLRGLLGRDYWPRWCKLRNETRLKRVIVVLVKAKSSLDWKRHVNASPRLRRLSKDNAPVELCAPKSMGINLEATLKKAPVAITDLPEFQTDDWKEVLLKRTVASDAQAALQSDGMVTWVDTEKHSDVFDRRLLLLDANTMIAEGIPTPFSVGEICPNGEENNGKYWSIFDQKGGFLPVTATSPMFAMDIEMCRGVDGSFVPVWIAVVNEQLQCVLKSLIKPGVAIGDYLTKFSGVSKSMLVGVETTLSDVAESLRQLLPPDAILVGHQIGCDLSALKLVHPYIIDTCVCLNLKGEARLKSKLRDLAQILLGKNIQEFKNEQEASRKGHDPEEDASATMELALLKLRNHPLFGNLAHVHGVPEEWSRMPIKFMQWYEAIRNRQAQERISNDNATSCSSANCKDATSEPTNLGAIDTIDECDEVNNLRHSTSQMNSNYKNNDVKTLQTKGVQNQTHSNSMHCLTIQDSCITFISLDAAFRSTMSIYPQANVAEIILERDNNILDCHQISAESDCTFDKITEGAYYTIFSIGNDDMNDAEPTDRGNLRLVDACAGKLMDFLPKRSLLLVAFEGRTFKKDDLDVIENGLVFGEII